MKYQTNNYQEIIARSLLLFPFIIKQTRKTDKVVKTKKQNIKTYLTQSETIKAMSQIDKFVTMVNKYGKTMSIC